MISRPDHYLQRFIDAGADLITVHVEAPHDVAHTLRRIRTAGRQAGLALNPATPISAAEPFLDLIDLLLCMTVIPGLGGQAFMPEVLDKITAAARLRETTSPVIPHRGGWRYRRHHHRPLRRRRRQCHGRRLLHLPRPRHGRRHHRHAHGMSPPA